MPEALLEDRDVKVMIQAADNPGAGLWSAFSSRPCFRPGELLGMRSSNVGFKRDYYIITVNVKTGIKRTPLVTSLMRSWSGLGSIRIRTI